MSVCIFMSNVKTDFFGNYNAKECLQKLGQLFEGSDLLLRPLR